MSRAEQNVFQSLSVQVERQEMRRPIRHKLTRRDDELKEQRKRQELRR